MKTENKRQHIEIIRDLKDRTEQETKTGTNREKAML